MFLFLVAIIGLQTANEVKHYNICKHDDFKGELCQKYKGHNK